jgi:UDP-N-acetylmuramyl pentapeptide synthase
MASHNVYAVDEAGEALSLLKTIIEADDVVLVKGSRAVGLEGLVMALAQPPERREQ